MVFCLVFFHIGFPGWLHVQVMEVALVSSLLVHEELCWSETCDLYVPSLFHAMNVVLFNCRCFICSEKMEIELVSKLFHIQWVKITWVNSYSEAKSNGWTRTDFKQQVHGSAENWSEMCEQCLGHLFPGLLVTVLMFYSQRSLQGSVVCSTAASLPRVLLQPCPSTFLFLILSVGCRAQPPGCVSRREWGLLGSQGVSRASSSALETAHHDLKGWS